MVKIIISSLVVAILFLPSVTFSYDDQKVHPIINEKAAYQSQYFIDWINKNGFSDPSGILEKPFLEHTIREWLRQGGTDEDNPDRRALNHFHDPTYPASQWNKAGFGLNDSALVWAQESTQSILGSSQMAGGTYSWFTARASFYNALTNGSEAEFAKTFRSLGQVMHIISDMAVPAHVRADPHLAYIQKTRDPYEDYTAAKLKDADYQNSHPVTQAIFTRAVASVLAPAPISALWDQDVCNNSRDSAQTNCAPDALWSKDAGLAEFTNANFLSRDSYSQYAHPNFADHGLLYEINWHNRPPVTAEDNKIDSPAYIWRLVNGQRKYRLAAANYFTIDTDNGISTGSRKTLDDQVYKDYAGELIPRAIGYSTAMLDYFFRGKIEITPPNRFVLGIIDDADFFDPNTGARKLDSNGFPIEQEFTQLKAKVRNISEDEMGSGTIQLVARYLGRDDYIPDLYNDPPQPASVQDGNGNFYPYSYSVSLPVWIPAMSKTNPTEYTFNFNDSPIPAGITDLDIFVVFKGTLGQEVDNAVAVGRIAEMNEPLHYSVENSTDYYIQNINTIPPITGQNIGFQVCFNSYPGTCQLPLTTTIAPGEYSKMLLLYAGQKLGFQYKDTFSAQAGSLGWISNNSRSKFLTTGINTQILGFRGVQTHAVWLSWTYFNYLDPYTIPAFTDPSYTDFHPFVPARPVHVNMPQ